MNRDEMEEEVLTRLLGLANEAPPVPKDAMERTRDTTRSVWQRRVRARRRRTVLRASASIAAVILIALSIAVLMEDRGRTGAILAHVEAVRGEVWLISDQNQAPLHNGMELQKGATLRTGASGRGAIRLASGHSVRMDHSTRIELDDSGLLSVPAGAIYVDSGEIKASGIRVRTPLGEATDIGTSFAVRVETRQMELIVRSGIVRVDLPSGPITVEKGRGIIIRASSQPSMFAVAPDAPRWDWARSIAPPFEIEGRTVAAFLEWYGKETGKRIEYGSVATRSFVDRTTLHGAAIDLASDESVRTVLLSAGLKGSLGDGTLQVEPISDRAPWEGSTP